MWTIHKFTITPDTRGLTLPAGSKILTCQVQDEEPRVWAMVDTNESIKLFYGLLIVGTGHPAPPLSTASYLSTVQLHDGALVFHVFTTPPVELQR